MIIKGCKLFCDGFKLDGAKELWIREGYFCDGFKRDGFTTGEHVGMSGTFDG